jgi:hypothetical protein
MTTVVQRGVKTFLLNHGQIKQLMSICVPSTKKRDVTVCTNSCIIAPFPHANKILLRIIQKQIETNIGYETPMKQAGLTQGHGSREHHKYVKLFYRTHRILIVGSI